MPYSYSDTIPDKSVCERVPQDTLIEVYVWEAFTVKRTISYASYLAEHSFDSAPVAMENLPLGRTCYRFTQQEWHDNVRPYLILHWIPVSVRMVSLAGVSQFH
ncbi:MAG TPA: hypothetical protein VGD65_10280 [Chryseosolibacter sp.]